MLQLKEPKDFAAQLQARVIAGTAYVIKQAEYVQLPSALQARYYPLFNRGDTPYRLKKEYMKPRKDVDPNTVTPVIIQPRAAVIPRQISKSAVTEFQPAGYKVSADGKTTKTPLSKKSLTEIVQETKTALANPPKINASYSRY